MTTEAAEVKRYLLRIGKIKLLTRQEELSLAIASQDGDPIARKKLI